CCFLNPGETPALQINYTFDDFFVHTQGHGHRVPTLKFLTLSLQGFQADRNISVPHHAKDVK
ncbi:MAG: hypothetical protein AAB069_07485, partial [Planctomycetota bacterium]